MRKPNDGMIKKASKEWSLNLKKSIMLGDSDSDEKLAKKMKFKFHRVSKQKNINKIITILKKSNYL